MPEAPPPHGPTNSEAIGGFKYCRDAYPTLSSAFLIFMKFLGKNWSNYRLAPPPPWSWLPSLRNLASVPESERCIRVRVESSLLNSKPPKLGFKILRERVFSFQFIGTDVCSDVCASSCKIRLLLKIVFFKRTDHNCVNELRLTDFIVIYFYQNCDITRSMYRKSLDSNNLSHRSRYLSEIFTEYFFHSSITSKFREM